MSGAGAALQVAASAAVAALEGLTGVYPGPALQAALPYAIVESGSESDWSHKSGRGREMRLIVTVRAGGERPMSALALADQVEAAIEGGVDPVGWTLASLRFLRRFSLSEGGRGERRWSVTIEWRARMLEAQA
jgi:hypothetical protein